MVVFGLPFAFAFGAGFAALASPCGIAMLPAYVGYYLGSREQGFDQEPILIRLLKALSIGGTATLAFVVLFGAFGLVWAALGSVLREFIPGGAIAVGIGLMILGVVMLVTGKSPFLVPTIGVNWGTGSRSYFSIFLFGLAYALATLSCTFPIFLAVMGNALTLGGPTAVVSQFVFYALGMGIGLIGITLGAATFKNAMAYAMRSALPYMERVSAVILVGAGGYITYYWYTNWFAFNANL
ncbi:MAG: cytochrome c biogenesis protein CcdA [Chloroflexi bacterium]|nr:cytochrome c biogenesis protein CcdA [Chloroflexota bacterium]